MASTPPIASRFRHRRPALGAWFVALAFFLTTMAAHADETGDGKPDAGTEAAVVPPPLVEKAPVSGNKARKPTKPPPRQAKAPRYIAPRLRADTADIAPTTAAPPRSRDERNYDSQLQAIRRALLEATLEQPARVVSTAWVDAKGALHESTQIQSHAEIRGVRVLAYTEKDGEPRAEVRATVLPWGLKAGGKTNESCPAPPRQWRLPLPLESRLAPGFAGDQRYAGETLLEVARRSLREQAAQSRRWYAVQRRPTPAGQYQQALAGGPAAAPSGWVARLELRPSATEERSALSWAGDWLISATAPWRWTLALTVGPQDAVQGDGRQWEMSAVIEVPRDQLADSPHAWQQREAARIAGIIQSWIARIDAETGCEPPQFLVRRQAADEFAILAGEDSGLRAGDRVLLINRARLPGRMLDIEGSTNMALAEIRQVGAQRSALTLLAGPPLPEQGEWVALPF